MIVNTISSRVISFGFAVLVLLFAANLAGAGPRVLHDQAHGEAPPPAPLTDIAKKLGVDLVSSTEPISAATLTNVDIVYFRAPSQAFAPAEKEAIVAFVQKGGSLFLVLDEERRQSLSGTGVNDLIAPFGLKLTADTKAPHNTGALARAGAIHKADREIPYSGGRAVEGGTPFSFIMGEDGKPSDVAHGAYAELPSGARIVVLGDAMVTLFMGSPEGKRLTGTNPQDSVYWGKDSAVFIEEVLSWLAAAEK